MGIDDKWRSSSLDDVTSDVIGGGGGENDGGGIVTSPSKRSSIPNTGEGGGEQGISGTCF